MQEVESYIDCVNRISKNIVDIVVVVNSDKYNQLSSMVERLTQKSVNNYRIADFGKNVGYLNSLLLVVNREHIGKYDYYILSNTDIKYDQQTFFTDVLTKRYNNNIGCIAPSVYSLNSNSYSNPHYIQRISKAKLERLCSVFAYPNIARCYLKLSSIKANLSKSKKHKSRYVYSPHGCYMIFTKEFIERIRGYKYGVKMYSEESAIGELLLRAKMRCYYDSSIEIVHCESTVTSKIDYRKRFELWRDSIRYIIKEFY